MANFTDPIKAAFGRYMHAWHRDLMADTPAMREFAARPFAKSVVLAPGRMIDQVQEMVAAWRKNDTSQAAQRKVHLPVLIVAMAKEFVPAPPEYGRGAAAPMDVSIPGDPKQRLFSMRAVVADIRTQVAIVAADEPTARSLALQLHAYTSAIGNRSFDAIYPLAGMDRPWPVALENPDVMAIPGDAAEAKNITIMTLDVTLRATVPLLRAPKSTEPNDGQGAGPNQHDPFGANYNPSGYPVVVEVHGRSYPPRMPDPWENWDDLDAWVNLDTWDGQNGAPPMREWTVA